VRVRSLPQKRWQAVSASNDHFVFACAAAFKIAVQIIGGEYAPVRHNARNEPRRSRIERRVVPLDALGSRPHAHGLKRKLRVPQLDFDLFVVGAADVRRARHEHRHTHVAGRDRDLQGADLVEHPAVEADGVRRAGEHVDVLALHDVGGHVVRDDRHVEAHVTADRRRKPRALEIGPRLGAEQPHRLAARPRNLEHHADDRLAETLGHDRAVLRKEVDEIARHLLHLPVARVVGRDRVAENCLVNPFP